MPNVVTLEEMQQSVLTTKIQGVSPFIQHKWSYCLLYTSDAADE